MLKMLIFEKYEFYVAGDRYLEQPNVKRPIFRNFEYLKKRKLRYSIFYFRFKKKKKFFKLLEHSKYVIIYKIENLWNFNSFPNFKTSEICYFSKL